MRGHLSDDELTAYRARTATREQFASISDHIFTCEQCLRLIDAPMKTQAAYDAVKELFRPEVERNEHLDYFLLSEFANGTLDEEDKAEVLAHAERCAECSNELKVFTVLKAQCDLDSKTKPTADKENKAQSLIKSLGSPSTFGLIMLALVVVWLSMSLLYVRRTQSQITSLRSTIAQLEQQKIDLQNQSTTLSAERVGKTQPILKDGQRDISIDAAGTLRGLPPIPATYQAALEDALMSGHLSLPSSPVTSLGRVVGEVRGLQQKEESFHVIYPTGAVVEAARPRFEWQRVPGATSYVVLMKDLVTGSDIEGRSTTEPTWKPDEPLVRGHQYDWMVDVRIGEQRIRIPASKEPYATFKVLDARQAREIAIARQSWGDSHLVIGIIYARAGLTREAELEFRGLVAANPESTAAKNLLASVEANATGRR